ncbi:type II and III secretion system protein family protein [Jiella sp. M17.18]|uniref:type II and III secretion system protein family protein n=1 Tax=Jiella sp. M17.18 TaxID=3234247 RepID=UPI0034DECDEE
MRTIARRRAERLVLLGLLLAVFAAALAAPRPALAQQRSIAIGNGSVSRISVPPGRTLTINTDRSFANLVVGDAKIADVVPLSDRGFYIQGIAAGRTNISIYDGGDRLLGVVDAHVSLDMSEVAAAIRTAVPGASVRVTNVNNRIALSGTVQSAPDVQRIVDVAQQFSNDPVINALAVREAQQVALEVRVLEARRSAGRDLGVNFRAINAGAGLVATSGARLRINADPNTAQPTTYLDNDGERNSQGTPFGTLVANVLQNAGLRIDVIINALEKKGLARRLAQPNLTTISGEKASFHAGGEVPIQTLAAANGVATAKTEYRPYGVRLEFLPTVLADGLINLRVMTEVSEIDGAINVNGNPGFTSRRAQTVIELRDGQSFAMAGLLQTVNAKTIQQLPWLGNLPVLGALFRSTSFQKQESDLVIVVTPRLVRPAGPGEPIHSPLDETRPSNDTELFALGLLEVDKSGIDAIRSGAGISGPYGHMLDFDDRRSQ